MTREPEWSVALPESWQTAPFWPERVEVIAKAKLPRGREALLVNAMLTDGTCIMALTWDRGRRMVRTSPTTAWAVDEHLEGASPGPGEEVLSKLWTIAVNAIVKANQQTAAEMGGRPS